MDVRIHQSGSLTKKGRLSKKANVHIRQALYMPALNAGHRNKALCQHYKQLNVKTTGKETRHHRSRQKTTDLDIQSLEKRTTL